MAKKPTKSTNAWICEHCRADQKSETHCHACDMPRYASWAVQVGAHVLEHLSDGLSEPMAVLEAMQARPCYARTSLTLSFIAQQMRLLTMDTSHLARQLGKARASRTMLEVLEHGDTKDKIQVMRGLQVLGDVVEHKVDAVTRHVVELHEGPPPKREDV
jgi:hypothetical protein